MLRKNFPDRTEIRRKEARERLEEWQNKTPQQQLNALDNRLGKGLGAAKQRTRLTKKLGSK